MKFLVITVFIVLVAAANGNVMDDALELVKGKLNSN